MKCREARELFSAYLDDALGSEKLQEFDAHMSACESCSAELESWMSAQVALSEALDADAVPRSPFYEFVSVCTVGQAGSLGWWASFVGWLEAPRRAVIATVAGSFVLTTMMIGLLWCAFGISLSKGNDTPPIVSPSMHNMSSLAETDRMMEGDWQNGF